MSAVEALDTMDARIPWQDPETGRGELRRVVSVGGIPRCPMPTWWRSRGRSTGRAKRPLIRSHRSRSEPSSKTRRGPWREFRLTDAGTMSGW